MTEQEFITEARKMGITDDGIESAITSFKLIKEHHPEASLQDFLNIAKRTQEELKNRSEDTVTSCGGYLD